MDGIDPSVPPSGPGCADCEAADPPGWWVHLRRCARCGQVGCCDSSPSQHASAHAAATGHNIVRSYEPGEEWFWDYTEQTMYEQGPELAAPAHRPLDQGVPGPTDRVPRDWRRHLNR
ncbi:UBP-type zinc finger domain-containing protein [Micromonospora sp. NPDC049900]|uniref:UBP-type zinc finger domain-containing protein n=1 Tax=unclassified Micromonospora TaxID=2617518 RepID=UPI0037961FF8